MDIPGITIRPNNGIGATAANVSMISGIRAVERDQVERTDCLVPFAVLVKRVEGLYIAASKKRGEGSTAELLKRTIGPPGPGLLTQPPYPLRRL